MNRRDSLKLFAGATFTLGAPYLDSEMWAEAAYPPGPTILSRTDEAFLDDMQRRGVLYFIEQAGAKSGQVLDRAAANNIPLNMPAKRDPRLMASIAATGFGLTALCIADKRRYHPHAAMLEQTRRTLRYHLHFMPHDHGFLYHFDDVDLGTQFRGSEVSSIDTALFLCGVLTARAWFHADPEIVQLATQLYERVDWPWMLNGGSTFSMGFRANKFIDARWNHFCELMMIYLLAIGSPTHPVDPATWDAWTRPTITYDGLTYIGSSDPIFTHQYSHAWFDFRDKRDKYANYFTNSILATRAHKAFCLSLGAPYSPDYWGISASDSQHGYVAWGGPSSIGQGFGGIDGSVVPNATAGSLPFLPIDCLRVLRSLQQSYPRCYGRYGFCDAFHPQVDWYDPDVLGIDLGIGLVMSENLRTGFIWDTFARNPEIGIAMQRAGFHPVPS
jgi:hypothetical protein